MAQSQRPVRRILVQLPPRSPENKHLRGDLEESIRRIRMLCTHVGMNLGDIDGRDARREP